MMLRALENAKFQQIEYKANIYRLFITHKYNSVDWKKIQYLSLEIMGMVLCWSWTFMCKVDLNMWHECQLDTKRENGLIMKS